MDIKQPSDDEQQRAYEYWLYMKYAKDEISEAYKAGYRMGYSEANTGQFGFANKKPLESDEVE